MLQEFLGNNDKNTVITNFFGESVHAECIRLTVLNFTYIPSLRFDLIGMAGKLSFANSLRTVNNKLMKGKALRKHSLHEKTAASVLLKLFISGNE